MKKKTGIITLLIIAFLAGVFVIFCRKYINGTTTNGTEYSLASVERGEIVTTITSTGTLKPVSTVDVGTQVSGIIDKLYVDYNDPVKKGQLIAELDRTVLSQALDEAIASRNRAKALFDLAEAEFKRNEPLFKKGFISEQEFIKLRTDYITQQAALQSAEASVKKAQTNLQYAKIYSPINGTVIERNIEVGQTVAASFSAPTLFVIAEDLKRMQILASVDEADVGGIRQGQEVRFTVQAFPDKSFTGTVEQVRLQPTVSQNVVTYTAVITTQNVEGILLPGMTATVDFIIEKATNVFKVPNAALRFQPANPPSGKYRPSAKMAGQATRNSGYGRKPSEWRPGNSKEPEGNSPQEVSPQEITKRGIPMENFGRIDSIPAQMNGTSPDTTLKSEMRQRRSAVWVVTQDNSLRPIFVKTGITDGKFTEISSRENLHEGMQVVIGSATAEKKKQKKTVSLLPQPGMRGHRR